MWLFWILIGVLAVVVWLFWANIALCPRCGIELPKQFAAPWMHAQHCRCGWRAGERP